MANESRFGRNFNNGTITRGQFLRTAGIGAGAIAAVGLGLSGVARASGDVHVYPDTPISVIQGYVNSGGTIYFHSRTANGVKMDYDFTNGLVSVGLLGNDAELVGVSDYGDEKPKIVSGPATRMGALIRCPPKALGGRPVKMRLYNLELESRNSTAAVFVANSSGTEITNCIISTPQSSIRSFGVWFIFRSDYSYGPATGPIIIKDNEFYPSNSYGALGCGNFFNTPLFSFLFDGNKISASNCAAGVMATLHGNLTGAIVSNNVVAGNGAMMLYTMEEQNWYANNLQVFGNDLTATTATACQMYFGWHVSGSKVWNNNIGKLKPVALSAPETYPFPVNPVAGIWCKGKTNQFLDNDFRASEIPGWLVDPYYTGCIYLGVESQDNYVFESGNFPTGTGGAAHQCWDHGVNNRVVGLRANEMTGNPGIGQIILGRIAANSTGAQAGFDTSGMDI
ncbi:hypothetical protein L0Y65_01285 [Candidatus Micrarchaeota archaeon]|nr:hypothetical protein [Candidatus Micrarchaeota archaeon]